MQHQGGPTKNFPLAEAALAHYRELQVPDFTDTEATFRHQSDGELKWSARLFGLMGKPWLTDILAAAGIPAVKWNLPGAKWAVRNTVFPQFVGGVSLEDSLPAVEKLQSRGVTAILDFGAEAKNSEAAFDNFASEVKAAIDFAADNKAAVAGVVKITGLAHDEMLARLNDNVPEINGGLTDYPRLQQTLDRIDGICSHAASCGVQIYIDAEESWMQNTIDALAATMMERYNKDRVVVLHTYQLYRHDKLQLLKDSHRRALDNGYLLGAKLVRGAYMVKENDRAEERGYPTPIQPTIEATHRDFNAAVQYCLTNHRTVGTCIGSHNVESVRLTCRLMAEAAIPTSDAQVQFAQLYGMSDNLTYNLAEHGYNVSKYLVYGPVREVLPYLVRRAQENTSVTGEMGRELKMIKAELARRGA